MGFELVAFIGKSSELRKWKERLPSAVVCDLGGDLGLVPVTGKLSQDLRALDRTAQRWGKEASANGAVAYIDIGEFGNQSHEEATLWSDGREVLSRATIAAMLAHFRDKAGLDLGDRPIEAELERQRGEDAAERWVAAASATNGDGVR